jgi:sec-independent protein translocase protein TatA
MGQMLGNIGPLEIIVVLIIALVVFGPKRLPELGSSLGRGIREFRDTVTGDRHDDDDDAKALQPSSPKAAAAAPVEPPAEPEVVNDKRS